MFIRFDGIHERDGRTDTALTAYAALARYRAAKTKNIKCIRLFIARQHTDARHRYSKYVCPSVCLSVCPSVTFRYQMKTA